MTVSMRDFGKLTLLIAVLMIVLSGCQDPVIVAKCPQLANPPPSVTNALRDVYRDPEGRRWVIDLSKHLDKLKVCR